ncbi:MAG: tRNA epoxyqueuosine(34) reductase QueG [Niabella sp.]
MNLSQKNTLFIKQQAARLGFDHCGIAKARQLDEDARKLEAWLNKGMNGEMRYMENHFDLRIDPTKLVPDAKSVITLMINYYPSTVQHTDGPKISKYAYGKDYHEVIRAKLNELLYCVQEQIGQVNGRGFVDSAPVMERTWANKSGLGWIGKSGNLLTKQGGSFFFIATLITDLALEYDDPFVKDFCGSCTKCIDACPTHAILPNRVVDGSRCISYFTIELKNQIIPDEMRGKFDNWMFGCDTCQDVCPWNRFSKPTQELAFTPIPQVMDLSTREWKLMTEDAFRKVFKDSPIKRAKHAGIMRNLAFIQTTPERGKEE